LNASSLGKAIAASIRGTTTGLEVRGGAVVAVEADVAVTVGVVVRVAVLAVTVSVAVRVAVLVGLDAGAV
jgi:hypothetical protein